MNLPNLIDADDDFDVDYIARQWAHSLLNEWESQGGDVIDLAYAVQQAIMTMQHRAQQRMS